MDRAAPSLLSGMPGRQDCIKDASVTVVCRPRKIVKPAVLSRAISSGSSDSRNRSGLSIIRDTIIRIPTREDMSDVKESAGCR